MTNVELKDEDGDTEALAKLYNDGNISKSLRVAMREYHHRRQHNQKVDSKVFFFQSIMFMFLGSTFLLYAISIMLPLDILTILAVACLVLSGIFSFLFAIMNIIRKRKLMNGGMPQSILLFR